MGLLGSPLAEETSFGGVGVGAAGEGPGCSATPDEAPGCFGGGGAAGKGPGCSASPDEGPGCCATVHEVPGCTETGSELEGYGFTNKIIKKM